MDAKAAKKTTKAETKKPNLKMVAKAEKAPGFRRPVMDAKQRFSRYHVIPDEATIVLLLKECPFRKDSTAAKTFACYRDGITVGAWRAKVREATGDIGYLRGDIRRGFIRVEEPQAKKE